jgi:hypothetical protein
MSEDFLAILKLVSGEEVLSNVSYIDDEKLLILDCPVVMKSSENTQMGVNVVRVEPWIKTGYESLYIMAMDKIITISEVLDSKITKIYTKFINSYYYNREPNCDESNKMTKDMGYISTVQQARATLEKLYNT